MIRNYLDKLSLVVGNETDLRIQPDLGRVAERRERLLNNPNLLKRLAGLAVHSFIAPRLAYPIKRDLDRSFTDQGYEMIGSGSSAISYLKNGEVTKILYRTRNLGKVARNEKIGELMELNRFIQTNYPQEATPASFHNIQLQDSSVEYIAMAQPFVAGDCAINPTVNPKVSDFATKSLDLAENTGLLPDVRGHNNLLVDREDNLRLVDTIPYSRAVNPLGYELNHQLLIDLASQ